jgi:hypothetical protein
VRCKYLEIDSVRLLAVLGGVDGASVDAAWCKLIERHDLEVGDLKSEEDYDYGVWRSFSGERGVEG